MNSMDSPMQKREKAGQNTNVCVMLLKLSFYVINERNVDLKMMAFRNWRSKSLEMSYIFMGKYLVRPLKYLEKLIFIKLFSDVSSINLTHTNCAYMHC